MEGHFGNMYSIYAYFKSKRWQDQNIHFHKKKNIQPRLIN